MRKRFVSAVLACGLSACAGMPRTPLPTPRQPPVERPMLHSERPRIAYPESPRGAQVDVYHGVSVPDPYRWLEDLDSRLPRLVEAQNSDLGLSRRAARAAWAGRLKGRNYERFGVPSRPAAGSSSPAPRAAEPGGPLLARPPRRRARSSSTPTACPPTAPSLSPGPGSATALPAYGPPPAARTGRRKVREVDTGRDLPDHLRWASPPTPPGPATAGLLLQPLRRPRGGGR